MKQYNYNHRLYYQRKIWLPYACNKCQAKGWSEISIVGDPKPYILNCIFCNGTGEQYEPLADFGKEKECYFCTLPFGFHLFSCSDPRFLFFPYSHNAQGEMIYFCNVTCFNKYQELTGRINDLQNYFQTKEAPQ